MKRHKYTPTSSITFHHFHNEAKIIFDTLLMCLQSQPPHIHLPPTPLILSSHPLLAISTEIQLTFVNFEMT